MRTLLAVLVLSCGLTACSTVASPREVVSRAADAEGSQVFVTLDLRVAAFGHDNGTLYLNAYEDYRDQRNVSLVVDGASQPAFHERFGPAEGLVGQRLRVQGLAHRQTIYFTNDGRPTGLYYFQTHLAVTDPDQVQVLD